MTKPNNKIIIILTSINTFRRDHPIWFWLPIFIALLAAIAGIKSCDYARLSYIEKHTPKLDIVDTAFYYQPFSGGNITGILVLVANQSDAWAKNVTIDFINNNGYSKYEKIKYYQDNKFIVTLRAIAPHDKLQDGYLPQGAGGSPSIYQNNEKKYIVDVFINWQNDKGNKYSLVAQYESIADNFNKQVRFKPVYKYDTFTNKKKVEEIKKNNADYLPVELI